MRFALDVGHHVICEGIMHSHRYGAMLTNLIRDHRGNTSVFYLDVSFEETLRRHASRPQTARRPPQVTLEDNMNRPGVSGDLRT